MTIQDTTIVKTIYKKLLNIITQKDEVVITEFVQYKRIRREEDVREKTQTALIIAQ